MRKNINQAMLFCAFAGAAVFARETAGTPLTVVNYSDFPVYSAVVSLPAAPLCSASGVPEGSPLQLIRDSGDAVPVMSGTENGKQAVRAFLSLKANETVSMKISPADGWSAADQIGSAKLDIKAGTATVDNGFVALNYRSGRWSLAYSGPMADRIAKPGERQIITDCRLDAWLDTEQRGRLMNLDPKALGLIHLDTATLAGGEAKVNPDGSVTLTLVKNFKEKFSDVVWTEHFILPAGRPEVIYRPVFENKGNDLRYLAYVDLGGGIRGKYGNLLRAAPMMKYEDPKEPNRVLLSGSASANAYTRVPWRGERCWVGVESGLGCGVGFSTLDEVKRPLIGSTVWSISSSEFFACLLQANRKNPTDDSNFPYEINPGRPLDDVGMAFIATCGGVDIWNETRQLFKAVIAGKNPTVSSSCAVYLNGNPLLAGEVRSFSSPEKMIAAGTCRVAALEIDFKNPYRLTMKAGKASADRPVKVSVKPLTGSSKAIDLMVLDGSEAKTVDFTGLTGWRGKRQAFVLQVSLPDDIQLDALELVPAPFAAPELSSPSDKLSLTDLAVFFRWKGIKGVIDYELQMARTADFRDPVVFAVRSEIEWPVFIPTDSQLPAPGVWYWRVRALDGENRGEWSVSREMAVNNDHRKTPLQFSITPQHPLFTFEGFGVKDWSKFKTTIPEDIRPYMAFNCAEKFDLIKMLKPLHENNQRVFIRTHHPSPVVGWTPLADVEEAFQKYPNTMGVMGGESLSASYHGGLGQTYANRLLKLCGKYGRIFYEADGTYPAENKWEQLYIKNGDLMREYGDYLLFAQKNNILHRQFVSQSSVMGLYLSGAISNQGSWEDGGWYWQQVGFKKLGEILGQRGGAAADMPRIFYDLTFLMGVSRGCSVFSLEGQTGIARVRDGYRLADRGYPPNASPSAYYTSEGELTPSFNRFIAPFIRGVIKHGLVPTKEQVCEQIRLAVYNDGVVPGADADPYYYEWEKLYAGTYGFKTIGVYPGTLMEFFPNTGRYCYFPIFPQGKTELKGIQTLPLSKLQDASAVKGIFDQAYPQWYEGDALITMVGDTLTVMNSNENTDEKQTYAVPLKNRGSFLQIAGSVEPHSYVMGKFEDGSRRLWLQANTEYAERPTELQIRCSKKPEVKAVPETAVIIKEWDAKANTLRLKLDHKDGAVELELN